ncbi:MAG TPA: exodeoxyribonuclease VII small subunit [Phycisphaerales bacterium]|nr:exodeoxyribonuclease VII small subunit [Phycisphaerales bacterium]
MAKQKLTFEEALAKLEKIVSEIEQGAVPLEKSIEKYAEGNELVRQCRAILDEAEKKIQLLTRGEGDRLEPAGELADEDETAER